MYIAAVLVPVLANVNVDVEVVVLDRSKLFLELKNWRKRDIQ